MSLHQNHALRAVLAGLHGFIKNQWEKTSLLVLAAAVFSAFVAFLGYRLQLQSNEPKLATASSTVFPAAVTLNFMNMGKRPAKQGTVTLFSVNEAHTRGQKLGTESIISANSNVILPQAYGYVHFEFVEGSVQDRFLFCSVYFDGATRLQQAFSFRRRIAGQQGALDEIEEPNYEDVCN